MRLEWIEDILAVLDTGSFNAAADQRFLTPSAFTRRVRSIEEALGCELFDRSKRPVVLKDHVVHCVPELRNAVATLKDLKHKLSEPDAGSEHQVTLICQHALAGSVAPQLLLSSVSGAEINTRIKSGSMSECLLQLVKREAQFALIYQPAGEDPSAAVEVCEWCRLGRECFVPVATQHVFDNIKLVDGVRNIPIIKYPTNIFLGEMLRDALFEFNESEQRLVPIAESGLSLAVVEFVRRGIGVGWVPESIVRNELNDRKLVNLTDQLPSFDLDVVLMRLNGVLPTLAEDFWQNAKR